MVVIVTIAEALFERIRLGAAVQLLLGTRARLLLARSRLLASDCVSFSLEKLTDDCLLQWRLLLVIAAIRLLASVLRRERLHLLATLTASPSAFASTSQFLLVGFSWGGVLGVGLDEDAARVGRGLCRRLGLGLLGGARVALVRDFASSPADDIPALLLLDVVELLLARLVNRHDLLLQGSELLLELRDHIVQLILLPLILVELFVEQDDLRLIVHFFPLVERLLEHNAIALVLQLSILLPVCH